MSPRVLPILIATLFLSACGATALPGGGEGLSSVYQPSSLQPTPTPTSVHTPIACTLKTQGGTCDFIIALVEGTFSKFNGTNKGVTAGNRICLKNGSYPTSLLWIEDVTGTSANPVEMVNCGGKFSIGNSVDANHDGIVDASRGILINNSKYFKLSGTGSTDTYGIKIEGSESGKQGVELGELSSDFEISFLEVAHTGFAGIMAKTDPGCNDTNPNSFRGGFVQRNSIFHDNYIHDTQGEGFYIGFSFGTGLDQTCSGSTVTTYSHPVDHVEVYNNILERTGCEAIQVGMGSDVNIHHNYVVDYGQNPFANYQNNGIQLGDGGLGTGTSRITNNFVDNSNANFQVSFGIIDIARPNTLIANNLLLNPGSGIYLHTLAAPSHTISVINNTIVAPTGTLGSTNQGIGIQMMNSVASSINLQNNLIVLGPTLDTTSTSATLLLWYGIRDQNQGQNAQKTGALSANISSSHNLIRSYANLNSTFTNKGTFDFHVVAAEAINQGSAVSSYSGLEAIGLIDLSSQTVQSGSRSLGSAIDIGAFEGF